MPLGSLTKIFGATKKQTISVLREIELLKVGNVESDLKMNFTITNRRMFREWQDVNSKSDKRLREAEPRNGNGKITESSKTHSSSSEKEIDNKSEKKKKKSRVESSRIPEPFPLTDEMIDWAKKNVPGLRLVAAHDKFVEYYTNLTTAKAFKVNWRLTWENGMKLALTWQIRDEAKGKVGKSDYVEEDYPECPSCHNTQFLDGDWKSQQPCPDCVGKLEKAA